MRIPFPLKAQNFNHNHYCKCFRNILGVSYRGDLRNKTEYSVNQLISNFNNIYCIYFYIQTSWSWQSCNFSYYALSLFTYIINIGIIFFVSRNIRQTSVFHTLLSRISSTLFSNMSFLALRSNRTSVTFQTGQTRLTNWP